MNITKLFQPKMNLLLSLLCILMLVCQFLPFWDSGEATCSLQRMIWFPNDQGSMPDYISDATGEKFDIDSVVWLTLLTLICAVLGACFGFLKREYAWPAVFPAIGGLSAMINYLTRPALQIGTLWGMHLVNGICLFVFAVISMIVMYMQQRNER